MSNPIIDFFTSTQQKNEGQRSSLQKYEDLLNTSQRRGTAINIAGGIYNMGVVNNAMKGKKTEEFTAPRVNAPFIASPGPAISNLSQKTDLTASGNASRKMAAEMGRPDLISGINANELLNTSKLNIQGLMTDYDIKNRNMAASVEADNANNAANVQIHNTNIEKTMQENAMDSQVISQGIGQLYSMGANLVNSLNTSDYYKLLAGNLYEEELKGKAIGISAPAKVKYK